MQNPNLHFFPTKGWINDPNGLIFLNDFYHLFYQYNPDDIIWGPMHWGHARSKDLIHWEHLPIALKPDQLGQIFSGSIVYDENNTSNLFKSKPGLIAIYTNHLNKVETQSIAYSDDEGLTWKKYDNNPILTDSNIIDFRDPKVLWIDESKKWLMVIACGDHIRFYESINLLNWNYLDSFTDFYYDVKTPLECPDLIKIKDSEENKYKWILKVDVSNHPSGGPGALCIIGDFINLRFVKDKTQSPIWIDSGQDFYAAASWSNLPNEISTWIAWMNNWTYANEIPQIGTRGLMSIPRHLSLSTKSNRTYIIQQFPKSLKLNSDEIKGEHRNNCITFHNQCNRALYLTLDSLKHGKCDIVINFYNNSSLIIRYDNSSNILLIDRSKTTNEWSQDNFKETISTTLREPLKNLEIVVDTSSIEILVNDGINSISLLHFAFSHVKRVNIQSKYLSSSKCFVL